MAFTTSQVIGSTLFAWVANGVSPAHERAGLGPAPRGMEHWTARGAIDMQLGCERSPARVSSEAMAALGSTHPLLTCVDSAMCMLRAVREPG